MNALKQTKLIILYTCRDTTPTIRLRDWSLRAALFDGDVAAGLVPTLFAANIQAAEAAIKKDPVKAHYDINRINRALIMPEHVQYREALQLLKKHR